MIGVASHCPYCAMQCGMTVSRAGQLSLGQFLPDIPLGHLGQEGAA
ncbi:MAG: hypothetical protein ABR608_02580 [Pseudonocardiaceae bacterium]